MKKYILLAVLAFVFVPSVHADTLPCLDGELFNSSTGQPCPQVVLSNDVATLQATITGLQTTIEELRSEIKALKDGKKVDKKEVKKEKKDKKSEKKSSKKIISTSSASVSVNSESKKESSKKKVNITGVISYSVEEYKNQEPAVTLRVSDFRSVDKGEISTSLTKDGDSVDKYDSDYSCAKENGSEHCYHTDSFGPLKVGDTVTATIHFRKETWNETFTIKSGMKNKEVGGGSVVVEY